MTIFSVMCIRSIAAINSLTEVDEINQAPVIMPGAKRVIMDVIASTMKESNPLKTVRAIRSNTKQTAYNSKYFPAVLKRRSDKISTKGIRLKQGLTMFMIPVLLVLNISVVIVSSSTSFVRGSNNIPFCLF